MVPGGVVGVLLLSGGSGGGRGVDSSGAGVPHLSQRRLPVQDRTRLLCSCLYSVPPHFLILTIHSSAIWAWRTLILAALSSPSPKSISMARTYRKAYSIVAEITPLPRWSSYPHALASIVSQYYFAKVIPRLGEIVQQCSSSTFYKCDSGEYEIPSSWGITDLGPRHSFSPTSTSSTISQDSRAYSYLHRTCLNQDVYIPGIASPGQGLR